MVPYVLWRTWIAIHHKACATRNINANLQSIPLTTPISCKWSAAQWCDEANIHVNLPCISQVQSSSLSMGTSSITTPIIRRTLVHRQTMITMRNASNWNKGRHRWNLWKFAGRSCQEAAWNVWKRPDVWNSEWLMQCWAPARSLEWRNYSYISRLCPVDCFSKSGAETTVKPPYTDTRQQTRASMSGWLRVQRKTPLLTTNVSLSEYVPSHKRIELGTLTFDRTSHWFFMRHTYRIINSRVILQTPSERHWTRSTEASVQGRGQLKRQLITPVMRLHLECVTFKVKFQN